MLTTRKTTILILCFAYSLIYSQEVIIDSNDTGKDVIVLGGNENNVSKEEPTCVYSNGLCMNFPKGGLLGIYNPALGWSISQCNFSNGTSVKTESMILITTGAKTYYSFDSDSRILIRFTDESVSTMYRDMNDRVETKYENAWLGNTMAHYYMSYVRFQLDKDTRAKFLNPALGIKKIRIVFANGEAIDYELKGNRVMKFPEELRESYKQASNKNQQRIQNNDDSTF